eukprot:jgi/Mesvir1/21638/Mv04060-RA.1
MAEVSLSLYGNASSSHVTGQASHAVIERARGIVAKGVGSKPGDVVFTAGATESNNLIIHSVLERAHWKGVVLTTKIEHPSIIQPLLNVRKVTRGAVKVIQLPVDREGFVDMESLHRVARKWKGRIKLCAVIYANNEIGTIQNFAGIRRAVGKDVHIHADTTQVAGKAPIHGKQYMDSFTVSGHKIHGIKGVGALVVRGGISDVKPMMFGGGQEHGVRPGTESPPLIASLADAVRINMSRKGRRDWKRVEVLTQSTRDGLEKLGAMFNGPSHPERRMGNLISFAIPGTDGRQLVKHLSKHDVCANVGSACSKSKRSRVLQAIGVPEDVEKATVRIGLSRMVHEYMARWCPREQDLVQFTHAVVYADNSRGVEEILRCHVAQAPYKAVIEFHKYFGRNQRRLCGFDSYAQVAQDVNVRLKAMGYSHYARINVGGKIFFHPLLAVEICIAHNLSSELETLQTVFEENNWGHQHLFKDVNLHVLAAVAEIVDEEERKVAEKELSTSSNAHTRDECCRVDKVAHSATQTRGDLLETIDQTRAMHAQDLELMRVSHARDMEEMRVRHAKEIEELRARLRVENDKLAGDLVASNTALAALHNMHRTITAMDASMHLLRSDIRPRDAGFRSVIISALYQLYPDHVIQKTPYYFRRHFERELCDLVINLFRLESIPAVDSMGQMTPQAEKKIVDSIRLIVSRCTP